MVYEIKTESTLARPSSGEEIVITGMAGSFPESNNISEYAKNMYNKVDMVTADNRRWSPINPEIPHRSGKLNCIEKFDAGYFGISHTEADQMDPILRMMLEKTYEAIVDSGYGVRELNNRQVGVFVGTCESNSEDVALLQPSTWPNFAITGCTRSVIAQQIGHHFNLNGPTCVVNSACSTSLYAFEEAYRALREDRCESAIVAGGSLCLNSLETLHFWRLGVLAADGSCKVFDERANGYVRSEAIVVVYLQKWKNARRIYAQVVHAKTNSDGYKEEGVGFPLREMHMKLFQDTYSDCKIAPSSIDLLEAHGTGTRIGDKEETAAIEAVFCQNRNEPLLIGSVKSYIGHTEATSFLASLVKVLVGMENNHILPNINFKTPRRCIDGLIKGRLMVPVEIMPWPEKGSGLAAISSFGIGGSNAHIVLKRFCKEKPVDGLHPDGLPRLMCVSGRSEECVESILNDIESREIDIEHCRLIQQVFKDSESMDSHRGFIIRSTRDVIERRCTKVVNQKRELHLFFSEPNREIVEIGRQLYELQPFAEAVQRVSSMLSGEDVALKHLVAEGRFQSAAQLVLVNLTVQLSLVDLFKKVNCPISYSTGRSLGALAAAYANGVLSMEEAVAASLRDNDTSQIRQLPGRRARDHEHSRDSIIPITFGPVKHGSDCSSQLNVSSINTVHSLLSVLGNAYMMGFPISQELLYPPVNWPVSRGTPMISPKIKWNRDMDWFYTKTIPTQIERKVTVLAKDTEWSCLPGHVSDGLAVMPATGYLYIVWETFSRLLQVPLSVTRVTFENIKLHSMTLISGNSNEFYVRISKITHKFEVRNLNELVVSGSIFSTSHRECNLHTPVTDATKEYFSSEDIYKELRLRGYNYSGGFRGLEQSDLSGTVSKIKWKTNWITFMDCILQSKFVHLDTRQLYIPSGIEQLTIDAPRHVAYSNGESCAVYNQRETNIISSEGVQVRGLSTGSLRPRKVTKPLNECYKFVPLETELPLEVAVRVLVQIFVECSLTFNAIVVEVVDNNFEADALCPLLEEALMNDQPFVKSTVSILSTTQGLKSQCLSNEGQYAVIILREASKNPHLLSDANRALGEDGVVISRENPNFNSLSFKDFVIASVLKTEKETLVLLTKPTHFAEYRIITTNLSGGKFDWIEEVQGAVKNEENVLLVVQNEPLSGVLGFTNCLRRELGSAKLKCVFIMNGDAKFNISDAFFFKQLRRGLAINILKGGVWGTYRYLLLEDEKEVEGQHIFNDILITGDYSSLRWVEGPLSLEPEKPIVQVFSAGVNFKDVMAASGKIPYDSFTKQRIRQSTAQGVEFSGKDLRGRRVMGIVSHGAISTLVEADVSLLWPIPDNWSMEDGASVPVTYSTALYGIDTLARIVHGDSILIHSGSGGVGQAAINLALRYECDIFTTVGSEEKRQFIKDTFPEIPENHIGNSRDCTFEQMVLKYTKGRGVNIVINSLSEQKLEASLRCLASNGRFIEIGKYDSVNNKYISLSYLARGQRYCSAMLNAFYNSDTSVQVILWKIVHNALEAGIIKPLRWTSYARDDVEHIYRKMAAGKHIGKLIVKIREEEQQSPVVFKGLPRFWCDSNMTYVVVGGLGGFGLELVDWMVLKGGRKFLLISRSGIKNGYAASRIRFWKTYGAIVHVATDDISNPESCDKILRNAEKLGPVAGIFNLAVVLQDALFENQTEEDFIAALTPKATITHNLDQLSRKLCPNLKYFVVFSSISCGRGNVGQTNYGMGNSIAERICEKRKKEGFPGLAIQWGIIGDVGILAEYRTKVNSLGIIPQRISSCLSCLETFLLQREPIVSSMCISKGRSVTEEMTNVIDAIRTTLGITDLKTVSEHTTFAKLGINSMSTIEVKQILERNADVYINARNVRSLTFAKLKEMLSHQKIENNRKPENEFEEGASIKVHSFANDESDASLVYMLPGIELTASTLTSLARNLEAHVMYIPFIQNQADLDIESLAKSLVTRMDIDKNKFNLIAYSYGSVVALEVASILESKGKTGNVILIDGSIEIIKDLVEQDVNYKLTKKMESKVLPNIFHNITKEMSRDLILEYGKLKELISDPDSNELHQRLRSIVAYKPNFSKIMSQVSLFKSSEGIFANYDEDFKLQKYCIKPVKVHVINGDHQSILKNIDLALAVNCIVNNSYKSM